MEQVYGPGILGTVVLVDPATGLPYKAEGGGGAVAHTVLSDATATYSYMGVAPKARNNPTTDPWVIARITLASPNTALHATGAWNDRATLTYA
jgi:hypothetical protein